MRSIAAMFLSNIFLYTVRGLIVSVQLGAALVLAYLLGTKEFGAYAAMWALMIVGSSIVSTGAPRFLLRELPKREIAELRLYEAIVLALIRPLLLSILYAAALYGFGTLAGHEVFAGLPALLTALAAFAHQLIVTQSVFVRIAFGASAAMVVRDALPHLLFLVSAAILFALGTLTAIALFQVFLALAAVAILGLGLGLSCLGAMRFSSSVDLLPSGLRGFWLNGVLGSATAQLDVVLASIFLPVQAIGVYALVKRFANFVSFPQIIANDVTSVGASRAFANGDIPKVRTLCRNAHVITAVPAVAISLVVLLTQPVWADIYNIAATPGLGLIALFAVLANIASVGFGVNFMIASQGGLELQAAGSRILAIVMFVALSSILALSGTLTAPRLAFVQFFSVLSMNATIWLIILSRYGIDTSPMAFFRRGKSMPT